MNTYQLAQLSVLLLFRARRITSGKVLHRAYDGYTDGLVLFLAPFPRAGGGRGPARGTNPPYRNESESAQSSPGIRRRSISGR